MASHIRIKCPSLTCKRVLSVPESTRGKVVRCKNCSATIRVPTAKVPDAKPGQRKAG